MILNYLTRKYLKHLSKHKKQGKREVTKQFKDYPLSEKLEANIENFKNTFNESGDVKFHDFKFGAKKQQGCCLIYIDGMADGNKITEDIIKPLMFAGEDGKVPDGCGAQFFKEQVLYSGDITLTESFTELVDGCTAGDTVLLIDGCKQGLIISTKGFETRSITEPQTESVVRGPREGFTENFRTNTSLLRRKIKNPNLVLENLKKGEKTNTDIAIAYIKGVADPKNVKLVRERINKLQIDSILDAGYIEELIEDSPLTIFPTIGYTEKPDVVAGKILEGRIAIIVDGSPFALTVPYIFTENFHTSEDYYTRPISATILRLLRFFTFAISILIVPLYVAFTTYHQQLIPTTLLFSIADAREGTPFPGAIEALILIVSFEILREAGLRLPRHVGQAISIVGALIMGEAAVSAGIVGAPMVIVVAISAVATFATPEITDVIGILRLVMLFLAGTLGGFGITMGILAVMIHLANLKSFGTEYFTLLSITDNAKDQFVRMPLWTMQRRPKGIAKGDTTRMKPFMPPNPTSDEGETTSDEEN